MAHSRRCSGTMLTAASELVHASHAWHLAKGHTEADVTYRTVLAANADLLFLALQLAPRHGRLDELIRGLCAERDLFAGDLPLLSRRGAAVVLLIDRASDETLRRTLRSWRMQSCPGVRTILVCVNPVTAEA